MAKLDQFPITRKWPAKNSDIIQLYSMATPNGIKASVVLEELCLDYEVHKIDISTNVQKSEEFLSLNPNGRIPAMIDPNGPGGKPIGIFESGAILLYLAEKTGRLIPRSEAEKSECIQWLFFQMGGIGPMFGQFGHFYHFVADKVKDPYPEERYRLETQRLLGVLEKRLENRPYLVANEYTIADIATFPWIYCLIKFYKAEEHLGLKDFENVMRWYEDCMSRKASKSGIRIPA